MAVKRIDLDLAPTGTISTGAKQEFSFGVQFASLAANVMQTYSKYKIRNAKDLDFGQSTAGLPSVADGIMQLLQPVKVGFITATQVDGYTQTIVSEYVETRGVRIQNASNLVITKTGERFWDSVEIYFLSDINLMTDDIFLFQGTQYRVLVTEEWTEYGYNKYSVVQDYTKLNTLNMSLQ